MLVASKALNGVVEVANYAVKRDLLLSELGLAQSEIAFRQQIQHKRTVTSGTVTINCTKFISNGNSEEGFEDGSQDGLRDTLLRGSKAAVQQAGG